MKGGLAPTINGGIGTGIYFAEENDARIIAKYKGQGTGVAAIKCRVNPSKCVTGVHVIVPSPFN